jgi:hydrogenase maturation protease
MNQRILIAGIGNIFLGDDAFGVEVARELLTRSLPPQVRVVDFGIRAYDLAYALAEDYEAVVLVDATAQGQAPGTLYLIEPDVDQLEEMETGAMDAHRLNPVHALQMAKELGGRLRRLYLVGCEPATLDSADGWLGLSDRARAAVPKTVEMIETLVKELIGATNKTEAGLAPA